MESKGAPVFGVLAVLLLLGSGAAWWLRQQPAELAPMIASGALAGEERIPSPAGPRGFRSQALPDSLLRQATAAAPSESEPATQSALEPNLEMRAKDLRGRLEQFRTGPSGLAADQLVYALVKTECEALGRYTSHPMGTKYKSPPWDEDYREIHGAALGNQRHVYRFSRFEYPEFWTYVIEPALPPRPGSKVEMFAARKLLDDSARDILIQRAEQVLLAVGYVGGK